MSTGTLQVGASPIFAHPPPPYPNHPSVLKDPAQTASPPSSGSRFRPYASPKHHVTKGRYITSNDPRGYIPVYEYPLNGQWIMMDIDDGYILWTGIWKALGNSKADIVKMIESQPDLAPLIRRVRGGYLKIQGTWMPYEVALKLSRRVAWSIRDELIPLFGPTFPSTCLSPEQPGYGQVIPSSQMRRRSRKTTTQHTIMQIAPAPPNWTVVTPNIGLSTVHDGAMREQPPPLPPLNIRASSEFSMASPYSAHPHFRLNTPSSLHHNSPISPLDTTRFGTSFARPPSAYRKPMPPHIHGLSLDTRSLNVVASSPKEELRLPPLQSPGGMTPDSPYSLPPISALEDMKGTVTHDSAAVLRRLQREDDDHYPKPRRSNENLSWNRRYSTSYTTSPRSSTTSPRFQPYPTSQSYQDRHLSYSGGRSPSTASNGYPRPPQPSTNDSSRPVWSDASHGGDSTSNPSPTSPTTPNSLSENEERPSLPPSSNALIRVKSFTEVPSRLNEGWSPVDVHAHPNTRHGRISESETYPLRRDSYDTQSDGDSSHPHRPW